MSAAHRAAARQLLPMYKSLEHYEELLAAKATCRRGCSSCCYQAVRITLLEAVYIVDALHRAPGWDAERLAALRAAAAAQAAYAGSLPAASFYEDFMRAKLGCIFLDKDSGDCRVYDQRPFECRLYFVENDPADCAPERVGGAVRVFDVRNTMERAATRMLELFDEARLPNAWGSIAEMINAAFELQARAPSDFARWLQAHAEVVVDGETGKPHGTWRAVKELVGGRT